MGKPVYAWLYLAKMATMEMVYWVLTRLLRNNNMYRKNSPSCALWWHHSEHTACLWFWQNHTTHHTFTLSCLNHDSLIFASDFPPSYPFARPLHPQWVSSGHPPTHICTQIPKSIGCWRDSVKSQTPDAAHAQLHCSEPAIPSDRERWREPRGGVCWGGGGGEMM